VLGRPAFMTKTLFFPMIATLRNSNILFQHDQVSFVCPSDKNVFKNEGKYAAFVELC
jgi:hypothetical protein